MHGSSQPPFFAVLSFVVLSATCNPTALWGGPRPGTLPHPGPAINRATLTDLARFSFPAKKGDADPMDAVRAFRWQRDPRVLVFLCRTRRVQAQLFNRIAAFVEKRGMRGRIVSDRELAEYMVRSNTTAERFYGAHDYRSKDLARFFNQALRAEIRGGKKILNRQERVLLQRLLAIKVLRPRTARQVQGTGQVVLSVPVDLSPELRLYFLKHELRHGLYFLNHRYRNICNAFWKKGLMARDRQMFRALFTQMQYDPADSYLIRNEFQAYLLQTDRPLSGLLRYYAAGPRAALIRSYAEHRRGRLRSLRLQLTEQLRARLGPGLP